MNLPKLLIFINKELTEQVLSVIKEQLFITMTFTDEEYTSLDGYNTDGYFSHDGYTYPTDGYVFEDLKRTDRVLVLVDYTNMIDTSKMDLLLYFSKGLLSVQKNKYGPPGLTFAAASITLDKLVTRSYKDRSKRPTVTPGVVDQKSIDPFGGEIIIHHYRDNR